MPERTEIIAAFLDRHGWDPALRKPLAGDASFRHYDRLIDGDRRAVLMDAPPLQEAALQASSPPAAAFSHG